MKINGETHYSWRAVDHEGEVLESYVTISHIINDMPINCPVCSPWSMTFWWNRFGPMFAAEIRRNRIQQLRAYSNCQWHLDEVFVKINGETHYSWRAVDHEGEVLESYVTKRRDRKAALKFIRKSMKRYGQPHIIVTDKLSSYSAAMRVIDNADGQETGRWLNNRGENSHLPFRRRVRAMRRFRRMRSLQKFTAVHSAVCNHFNLERHLYSRDDFKRIT